MKNEELSTYLLKVDKKKLMEFKRISKSIDMSIRKHMIKLIQGVIDNPPEPMIVVPCDHCDGHGKLKIEQWRYDNIMKKGGKK